MVGHQAIGQEAHSCAFVGLGEHGFEGLVIGFVVEEARPADGTVEHVIDQTAGSNSQSSCHAESLPSFLPDVNYDSRPRLTAR